MRRKIFTGVLIVGLALAFANFTGTFSYFQDVETSEGNSLEAGNMDLQVGLEWEKIRRPSICNHDQSWEVVDSWPLGNLDGKAIFEVGDLYEGVEGKALLKLHLFGNPAWVRMETNLTSNEDGTCNCLCQCGKFDGELAQNVRMIIWEDYDGDGDNEANERKLFDGTMDELSMDENLDGDYLTEGIQAFENCKDYHVGIKWWVDIPSCCDKFKVLGDSLTFDIIFKAYQRRHQDDYYSEERAYFDIENSIGNEFEAWSFCQDEDEWDKSSLEFQDSWHDEDDNLAKAEIKNVGDEDMEGTSTWELYYSSSKNPMWWGQKVDSGTVQSLDSGESAILESGSVGSHGSGKYKFKAYQRDEHPGTGVLWSEEIVVSEEEE